jgi:hypothetical protein
METVLGKGRQLDRDDGPSEPAHVGIRCSDATLQHWARYDDSNGSVLEYELLPISTTVTGNVAVVQYYYIMARENLKKERESVTGHYTDILMKEGGKWMFIAWAGGDDPKK